MQDKILIYNLKYAVINFLLSFKQAHYTLY